MLRLCIMEKELKLKIFLKKSELRQRVWDKLTEEETASDIAKELEKHRSSISRVLLDLEKVGFVKCVNSEDSSFRYYVRK